MVTLTMSFEPNENYENTIKSLLTDDEDKILSGSTSLGETYVTLYFGNKKEARLAKKKVISNIEDAENRITFDIDEEVDEMYEEDY